MNSRTVARNSVWYGLETGIGTLLTFFTSIAIARTFGPANLGYFLYVWYLVNAACVVGGLGIPTATRKYMSEYYGRGEPGIARSIFYRTLRLQGMINSIPSQANMAAENMAANVPASLVSTGTFVAAVFISILTGVGMVGIAIGLVIGRTVELIVRMVPVIRRLRAVPPSPIPAALQRRMLLFSGRSMVLLILGLVVWDRSEMIFLKNFCADIRQVAFYSVAFNITERLLLVSQIFGQATGSTIMAQYGRDHSRLPSMVSAAVRYLALISMPVHFGLAAIAGAAMLLVYGVRYELAIPALTIAAALGVFKAFLLPVQHLMESTENQNQLIKWGLIAGLVNLTLDVLLIPRFGAVGAAIANGSTQAFSVIALWAVATGRLGVRLPYAFLARIALLSGAMALAVHFAVAWMPALASAAAGTLIGLIVYTLLLRVFGGLNVQDYKRLSQVRNHIPNRVRRLFDFSLGFIAPAGRMATQVSEQVV
jgi:O-antigen/teichoic acid export membrane protein